MSTEVTPDNAARATPEWSSAKPNSEGAYYIRGFNVCRPADEQFDALVQVRMHKPNFFASEESATLFCNLHESTSEEDMDNWIPVDELEDDFEWSGPLVPAAMVAALEAEVRELTADRDSWQEQASDRVADWDKERQRADAAERRVAEIHGALRIALASIDETCREMTIGDRFTNAGQSLIDAIPVCRSALTGARAK